MGYRLTPGLHFCVAGSKATFLDLNANQYFQLLTADDAAFQKLVSGTPRFAEDPIVLKHLMEIGVLTHDAASAATPKPVSAVRPFRSLPDEMSLAPTVGSLVTALAYQLTASIKLASTPICILLAQITQRRLKQPPRNKGEAPAEIHRAAAAFATSTLFLSSSDKCLRRSLAMIYYLADRGSVADLIVGIKDRPFEAHAWVQSGDTVLNDSLGKIIEYTPMVVI